MTHIELYINKKLCDIQSPERLGIRLNRVLINPAELNTKDAQYSYSITIPSTPANDAIFGYANVEEVKNKFNHIYTAQLYVDSVSIFDGQFKLGGIEADGSYKGNLVVPIQKTIKEIFGDKRMNEIEGEWKLDVSSPLNKDTPLGMVEMLNKYNTAKGIPDCIFPLVLYGLLPKVAKDEAGNYSSKARWDKYVRLGIHDFPPSINCMNAIKTIFKHHKDDNGNSYDIGGSAFNDSRLSNLYMSYRNPTDYQQEWNWGYLGKMKVSGQWTNVKNSGKDISLPHLETQFFQTQGDYEHIAVNLFNAKNVEIKIEKDTGNNISQSEQKRKEDNSVIKNTHIVIPASGFYKIKFAATMELGFPVDNDFKGSSNSDLGIRFAYPNSHKANNEFDSGRYELKLVRDRGEGSFEMDSAVIDGVFFKNNQNQEMNKTGLSDSTYGFPLFETSPKYFPQAQSDGVLFVDPLQNPNIISGFRWGKGDLEESGNPVDKNNFYCSILSAKNGFSWDKTLDTLNYCAVKSPGYWRYGVLQAGEDEIEEEVEEGDDDEETVKEYGYEIENRFSIDLDSPDNYVRKQSNSNGDGLIHSIIWLEKGERLAVVDVSDIGVWRQGASHNGKGAYIKHVVTFDLEIEPYQTQQEWITVNFDGTGTAPMKWDAVSDFKTDYINLIKFLPSEQKIDEWLNDLCNAFNLQLTQPSERQFELNVKQSRPAASASSLLDLDTKTSILQRTNEPLGLPSEFNIGFKIDKEEEGYANADENNKDGGGSFITGNIDGQVTTQTSNFSYNWFKTITKDVVVGRDGEGEDIMGTMELKLPVITNKEIWVGDSLKYAEMMKKLYTNYRQRFWYKSEKPDNVGVVWGGTDNPTELILPRLSYSLNGDEIFTLNYYNNSNSILTTYFSIIATDDSNYTYVECYLSSDEYEQLDGNKLVKLNGDLYYVAAVEGYDPMGRNKTKLKLIRKV